MSSVRVQPGRHPGDSRDQHSELRTQHWTLTSAYLARKEAEYEALRAEIEDPKGELDGASTIGKTR